MAIVRVRRLYPGRSGRRNFQGRYIYTLVWEVVLDDAFADADATDAAVDPDKPAEKVPVFGDAHPGNENALAVDIDVEQSDESPYIWYVTVTYDTQPDTPGSSQPTANGNLDGTPGAGNTVKDYHPNPLMRDPVWKTGSIERDEPVEQWITVNDLGQEELIVPPAWAATTTYPRGKYVTNAGNVYVAIQKDPGVSAGAGGPVGKGNAAGWQADNTVTWRYYGALAQVTGDPRFAIYEACRHSGKLPFDPPQMTSVSIPTLIVTKNIPIMDLLYIMLMKNSINLQQWGPIPPRCAKCMNIETGFKEENKVKYVEATWTIGLDPDTWDLRLLDQGYGSAGMRTVPNPAAPPDTIQKLIFHRFKDANGADFGHPVPMDGKGGMLKPEDDPVYLRGVPRQVKFVDFNQFVPFRLP